MNNDQLDNNWQLFCQYLCLRREALSQTAFTLAHAEKANEKVAFCQP